MFHQLADGEADTPTTRTAAYAEELTRAIEAAGGVAAVANRTELEAETVQAAAEGRIDDVTLAEGAAILGLAEDRDADEIVATSRDAILMGMASAVLDIEALATALETDLEPRELQQKIEGRFPITLAEYARVHHTIQGRMP